LPYNGVSQFSRYPFLHVEQVTDIYKMILPCNHFMIIQAANQTVHSDEKKNLIIR